MTAFDRIRSRLEATPRTWLVTGVAGFIGSHLLETLLGLGQQVVGLDDLSTGSLQNLDDVRRIVGNAAWARFRWVEGDIRDEAVCRAASADAHFILHQAALGSVPRSIEDPVASFESNVMGFLNILQAAKANQVQRVVYASSSAVYGDSPVLPKREESIGAPLSPYAATKYFDEVMADVFHRCYGLSGVGLRYFNVFGPRQDPNGAYAAVIPKWVDALLRGETVYVNGDGETSRDFCYVQNVVLANLAAALASDPAANNSVFNVAVNSQTTLNELFRLIRAGLARHRPELAGVEPVHRDFRAGDVRHSKADLSKVQRLLGYEPEHTVDAGMEITLDWYFSRTSRVSDRV